MLTKPDELFDRQTEWSELAAFVSDDRLGATLALLYGRRRQGKTLLLEHLAHAAGGLLVTGLEQSAAMNLRSVGTDYASYLGSAAPVAFSSWEQAVEALLALGEGDRPVPVIIDEFPYLLAGSPELPSILQRALSPRGRARLNSRARLILCGSAFSTMRDLLSGTAALRGRARRELVVHPFDYRQAATFWQLDGHWELALRVHALCGGTPAYLDYCGGDTPRALDELDGWVHRNLLNPSSAFFREGRLLVGEEPDLRNAALYLSVLTALSLGNTRRGQLAAALGRKESALAHPLAVLQETRLVEARRDALRERRTTYHIAEPILRLHQLVVAPEEARLTRRAAGQVWTELADMVSSKIYGPHFEQLCRQWAAEHAADATLGGRPSSVGSSVLTCPAHRSTHEFDLVVTENTAGAAARICAIGEAKWRTEPVGLAQLERLRHLRSLLPQPAVPVRLLLFSRTGFAPPLRQSAAASEDVELVDLERLYVGS